MGNESEFTNGLCHMSKMVAMPVYGKRFRNLLCMKLDMQQRVPEY